MRILIDIVVKTFFRTSASMSGQRLRCLGVLDSSNGKPFVLQPSSLPLVQILDSEGAVRASAEPREVLELLD